MKIKRTLLLLLLLWHHSLRVLDLARWWVSLLLLRRLMCLRHLSRALQCRISQCLLACSFSREFLRSLRGLAREKND
jgi:hypothetical protein